MFQNNHFTNTLNSKHFNAIKDLVFVLLIDLNRSRIQTNKNTSFVIVKIKFKGI